MVGIGKITIQPERKIILMQAIQKEVIKELIREQKFSNTKEIGGIAS
jgi:tRNA A-37 threonylcarbamoyl transferase component Bud32